MLIVLSPAKTLDYESRIKTGKFTLPDFLDDSQLLINNLQKLSEKRLQGLMNISEDLAELNRDRYASWSLPFTPDNARQAVLAFKGDVYTGIEADKLNSKDLSWAQNHLRILSGLYGLLRPLDLMQPYRLEMGTSLKTKRGKNLYAYWDGRITEALNEQLARIRADTLINLASNEYFKAVKPKQVSGRIISPAFRDWSNGQYRMIGFFAKKARGRMASWIIRNRIDDTEQLHNFAEDEYRFSQEASEPDRPVFIRRQD